MIKFYYKGKPVSVNRRYYKNFSLTKEYRQFKLDLGWKAKEAMQGQEPLKCPIKCEIIIYYKGRNPDIDNYAKPILDAMEGIVFDNDCQIYELVLAKVGPTTEPKHDGLQITIIDEQY